MIKVSTNDGRICYPTQVTIDLIKEIQSGKPIVVSTIGEGPCCQSLGLYSLLDNICDKFNYPKTNITIETSNLIEQHAEYNITRIPQMFYLNSAKKYYASIKHTDKTFDQNFKHFGHFIGHGNRYRLQLASYLYSQQPSTLQTYHCEVTSDYHRPHIGLEDLLFAGNNHNEIKMAMELLEAAPIVCDTIDSYPILMPATLNITKIYPDFFVELASITYFSGNTFYVDEKVWRPMMMLTPFMVQGSQNFILNLRKLGFQTFDRWWDEAYSEDPVNCQVPAMLLNIRRLAKLGVHDLHDLYQDMKPVLENNFDRLMSITEQDFRQVFGI